MSSAYHRAIGLAWVIAALIVCATLWAYFTEIDEIARGQGKVIPATRTQTIQATEPGVVKEIAVKLGQIVKEGDLVVRLDKTTTASDLGEVQARLRAVKVKIARLDYESRSESEGSFLCPEDILNIDPKICENERKLLEARQNAFRNTRDVLTQRLLQRRKEKDEAAANLSALEGRVLLSERELNLLAPMAKKKLVAETELIRAQKEVNDTSGQINALKESIPRIEGAIAEAELQTREQELQFRQEALSEKTEALAELSVLAQSERGESDRVDRTDIRSPVTGIINTLAINSLGSFVQPGTVVAEIVPSSEELLVEARISPRDIAFVIPGQKALIKITAFDFSIYGGLEGTVVNVSPDSLLDQKTGEAYFEIRVRTDKAYLEHKDTRYNITPGMICSVDVLTGRKTILQYILKPINKARQEALTER
ncbi:HlyD family type I secretion periplasmic adaptor subunit [Pseudohoeflea suaedae]|uniref:Membrane fusion protein (MFP) family protein n=1 Tax=Pseudohoeflea suaedae TaxID=877384 RepID=A0A4R5PHS7_9HYPH|nr:HlyD family type I secretion periplasmic adaptor subunit [Pseudohoeflea suaedae]TDH34484.1 HlyD family type I secretion periplasmic adaptor subunit [Pseudohoeflea suaedae]